MNSNLVKIAEDLYVPDNFEKYHHYYADPEKTKEYTGVTSILAVIAKPALIQWAADMACQYLKESAEYFEDRERWIVSPVMFDEARLAHRRKKEKAGAQGTDTHAVIEEYVKNCIITNDGKPFPVNPEDPIPARKSFIQWANENKVTFIESEKRVYSREWWVAGTTDLVFEKDGQRFVGDVKTMKKMWDRTPFFQCAAYMKMLKETDPNEYHGSCIINIPKETNKVETYYSFDWEADVKAFEAALTLYRALNQ